VYPYVRQQTDKVGTHSYAEYVVRGSSMNAFGKFPHRRTADGSFASICVSCLVTVDKQRNEEELSKAEMAHVCDPILLNERAQYLQAQGS
jgi:hypothetical protein